MKTKKLILNLFLLFLITSVSYSQEQSGEKLTKQTFYTFCKKSHKFDILQPIIFEYMDKNKSKFIKGNSIDKEKMSELVLNSWSYYSALLYPYYENKFTETEMKKINEILSTDIGEKYAVKDLEATKEYILNKDKVKKDFESNLKESTK
jgi:hypothetical protein